MTKSERKIPRGRSRRKWQNNNEMYFEVLGWRGLMCLRTRKNNGLLSTIGFHKMREVLLFFQKEATPWIWLVWLVCLVGCLVGRSVSWYTHDSPVLQSL
jgi:hypothetical protein